MKLSFTGIDVLHEGTISARQFVTSGYPVTIARPNVGICPVNVTPGATQRGAIIRVQAAPSSSPWTEVG
jgi:hypothetical protein